jgi:hypothetical protein
MENFGFKRIICILILLVIFIGLLPGRVSAKTPGETLKDMGYVVGFADGKIHEERLMKQGELVALVSRYIRFNLIPKEYKFMDEMNGFDRFVNKVYNFLVNDYNNTKQFFIRTYYELTGKEIYPGVKRGHYLFNSIVILRTYGFQLQEGIDVNAKLTSEDFFNILYGMLGFNENEFIDTESIPSAEKYRIIFALHGKRNSPILSKKGYLTRGEAFEEFLRLIQTGS